MFREIFAKHAAGAARGGAPLPGEACRTPSARICRLCHASVLEYEAEANARDGALREFWMGLFPGTPIGALVRSPLGRGYRTVSKRKAFPVKGETRLGLIDAGGQAGHRPLDVAACRIEPESHAAVYARVGKSMLSAAARPLLPVIRYVIVKGNYRELVVLLSVTRIDTGIVAAANSVSRSLTKSCPDVRGVMLFEDRSDGRYYLGTRNPSGRGSVRKIYGDTSVYQKFAGRGFLFPPLAFSQVNASLVDGLIEEAVLMLGLTPESDMYDLYCGYGLFTLTIGARARHAAGFERTPEAIEAAEANALRLGSANARFFRSDITGETLTRLLSRMKPSDGLLLDPPRSGTGPGVIECAAARRPGRVVHMFCNTDVIEGELFRWRKAGYVPVRAVPFDMFPGTDETEILVLLTPAAAPG